MPSPTRSDDTATQPAVTADERPGRYPTGTVPHLTGDALQTPVRVTETTDRPTVDRPNADPPSERARTLPLGLSLSQIIGGSLAAATAAALGSKLGVAGTIGGAALASVVSAVAGSLYTASVRRTREGVQQVFSRRPRIPAATVPAARTTLSEDVLGSAGPAPALSRRDDVPTPSDAVGPAPAARTRRRVVRNALIGAVAVFVVAFVGIFAFETLTGRALDGDRGTTIGQLTQPGSGSREPTTRPEPSTGASSPASTPSASEQPSSEPSTGSTAEPSSGTSTEPSTAPSEAPSSQPSTSSEPSTAPSSASSSQPSSGSSAAAPGDSQVGSSGQGSGTGG